MKLSTPKQIKVSNLSELLYILQHVFKSKGRKIKDVVISFNKTESADLIGLLCIFKAMEFSLQKDCFFAPRLDYNHNCNLMRSFRKFGLYDLLKTIIKQDEKEARNALKNYKKELSKLTPQTTENFIIAPQVLTAKRILSNDDLVSKFLPSIKSYYQDDKAIRMIFSCLSEVMLNFWKHASEDESSLVMAYGNDKNIEICCVDIGEGIVSSMSKRYQHRKERLIDMCTHKGITSKPNTDHMGKGLWLIDKITAKNGGRFVLSSEGLLRDNNNGKISVKETGYWKGAIIYITLHIDNPICADAFMIINKSLFTTNE